MTRKRISDLLREEAQSQLPDLTSKESTPDSADSNADIATNLPTAAKTTVSTPEASEATVDVAVVAPHPLEAQVQELTLALEKAQKNAIATETELQKQIATLGAELTQAQQTTKQAQKAVDEQKQLVQKLYTELNRENPLQAELEAQKQLIEKLSSDIESLKQPAVPPKSALTKSSPPPLKSRQTAQSAALSRLPAYRPIARPVGKTLPTEQGGSGLSNDTIGWFD